MKTTGWSVSVAAVLVAGALVSTSAWAQYKAPSSYTKKVVPPPQPATPAPPKAPAQPATTKPAPPPAPKPLGMPGTDAPAGPVDPAKAKAAKAEQDQKVIEFQKQRAASGSASAQYDLGVRYLDGDGVEKNPELARKWLEASAKNGNRQAAKKLESLKAAPIPPKAD
jgi:hypothetical protein